VYPVAGGEGGDQLLSCSGDHCLGLIDLISEDELEVKKGKKKTIREYYSPKRRKSGCSETV